MSKIKQDSKQESNSWNIETLHGNIKNLLVVCPKCRELGTLHWTKKIGWYVKHGSRKTHSVGDEALEVPLHNPRLNIIRYMGGDTYLLPYLARMIPPHMCYVEVFGGGAPLLLNKAPSKVEIYNDIDGNLVNLFKVVRDHYDKFIERIRWLVASRQIYYEFLRKLQKNEISDPIERAVAYWYVLRLSYAGKFGAGLGVGPRKNNALDLWNAVEDLLLIHERLKNVFIEQLDFRELIKKYDTEQTFFYCDPPHLFLSTEASKGKEYYAVGFTDKDYMDLLSILEKTRGKWLLKQSTEIPWLIDWAKQHGYSIERLVLKKSARANPRAEKNENYPIFFIANYNLKA